MVTRVGIAGLPRYDEVVFKPKKEYVMILPVTNVELPSDEWGLKQFRHRANYESLSIRFNALLHHAPTGQYAIVFSHGNGEPVELIWNDMSDEVRAFWDEFVTACHEVASDEEGVIRLMVVEKVRQKNFNGIFGTVVRNEAGDVIYGETVDGLRGRVQGTYWSSKDKRWVPLN